MKDRQIVISEPTARLLRALLRAKNARPHDLEHLHELSAELDRALVLDPGEVSPAVVTMHAPIRVRDLDNGALHELTLVSPHEADVSAGRISVLAPLGSALLGYFEGDVVKRHMPGGLRSFRVEAVLRAPDAGAAAAQPGRLH